MKMKSFKKIDSKSIAQVKEAIVNKKALLNLYQWGNGNEIVEYGDIYSLYDHDNLFIIRNSNRFYVAQLSKYYQENGMTCILAKLVSEEYVLDKLKKAGIDINSEMYQKTKDIFDKAANLENKYNELYYKDEDSVHVDIFNILSDVSDKRDKKKKNKEKVDDNDGFSPLGFTNDGLSFPFGILSNILGTSDNTKNMREMEEKATDNISRFVKNNKRFPNSEEVLDMILDNKEGLTKEEKQKIKKEFMNSPLFHMFNDDIR
jgi:hypothetical protein